MPRVIDQMQHTIDVPTYPKCIVSLVPSQTELLHYLGLGDRVVGITKFCVHPNEWYRSKTRVGGTKNVKFDRLAALKPDLIIGNKEENSESDIKELQKDYPVWMSDMQTFDEVWDMILSIGNLVGKSKEADILITRLQADIANLKMSVKKQPRLKVAYFIWQKPYMIAATNTFIDTMLDVAGFDNVFEGQARYPEITEEQLKIANPQAIFLSSEPYPFKEKHVAQFQAMCPNAAIEIVDGEIFSWYGSRMLYFVDYVKKLRQKLTS